MKERKIVVKFRTKESLEDFNKKIGVNCPRNTKTLHLPSGEIKLKKIPKKIKKPTPEWKKEWKDLFEYTPGEHNFYAVIDVLIKDKDSGYIKEFSELTGNNITKLTKSFYYPKEEQGTNSALRVTSTRGNPSFPIYVVSKTRADNCVTANYLREMGVPYYIVVEEHQYQDYAEYHDEKHLLILDQKFLDEYDTFDDLGATKSKGPGAARNFAWWHSIQNGHKWHWVMDDNVFGFYTLDNNRRIKAVDGGILCAAEDFVERYDNIAIAGLNYFMFVVPGSNVPAYVKNTRIYSMLLIRNDIPYRWRGRYNEDTDLSLRVLKDGWSTVQFNAVMGDKLCTQSMKGGNTEEFYAHEGTLHKSKMLEEMHPDVAKVHWRFGRWHHYVDYSPYSNNPLGNKSEYKTHEFGLNIIRITEEEHKNKQDSKKYVYKKYLNQEVQETDLVLPDILPHRTPSPEKIEQGKKEKRARELKEQELEKRKKEVTKSGSEANKKYKNFDAGKSSNKKVAIIATENFKDTEIFKNILDDYKSNEKQDLQLINLTEYDISIMCIKYGAENKYSVIDFKPDYVRNGGYAKHVEYEKISNYVDEAIVFKYQNDEGIDDFIEMMKSKDKNVIIKENENSVLDEW